MKRIRQVVSGHPVAWLMGFGLLLLTANLSVVFLRANHRVAIQAAPVKPSAPAAKPLEGRESLVKRLRKESLFESIENLPNFDDSVWVLGTIGGGGALIYQRTYQHARQYIPRLNRVRKILAQVKAQRAAVVGKFTKKLLEAADGFPACYRAGRARVGIIAAPEDYDRRIVYGPAATYLIAELQAHDALPAMSKVYSAPGPSPVGRLFLFYAMHLLAVSHPREHLTPQAITALQEYLVATKTLPEPGVVEVPAWDAAFEETDFRVELLGQDVGLDKQPKLALRIYTAELDKYEDFGGNPATLLRVFVKKLDAFIKLAYPTSK